MPGFIINAGKSRISVKRAYIKDCHEMMSAGAPPALVVPV